MDLEAISFWSARFKEHFEFMKGTLEAAGIKIEPKLKGCLTKMQNRWQDIENDPTLYKDTDRARTLKLKEEIKGLLANSPCDPDLLEHMIEELNYFQKSIIENSYSLKDEIVWWATEHAENVRFVDCKLPKLIEHDNPNGVKIPAFLQKAFADNEKLANDFEAVAQKHQPGYFTGITKALGLIQDEEMTPKDVDDFIKLKEKHLDGINTLISKIPVLPLNKETKETLWAMLNHERDEAQFAYDRIHTMAQLF